MSKKKMSIRNTSGIPKKRRLACLIKGRSCDCSDCFWEYIDETAKTVASWPAWKRGGI